MVSPANTYPGLTTGGPGTESGEPDKYYPTGTRNYARVVANDTFQGKVDASYMKDDLGVTKVFILDDRELYGKGVADVFESSAKEVGLTVAGHTAGTRTPQLHGPDDADQVDGRRRHLHRRRLDEQRRQLVKDKVSIVGDNEKVKLMVADGFVLSTLFEEAGPDNVNGAFGSAPTKPPEQITGAGKQFFTDFEPQIPEGQTIQVYTIYAAAAAQVLLDAISRSDGTRGHRREDVRDEPHGLGRRSPRVRRERRPEGRNGSIYSATGGNWSWKEEKAVS